MVSRAGHIQGTRSGLSLASIGAWRYAGGRRDARLDLLRGFAALAMVVDHVALPGGRESALFAVTGGDRFFVSAAEAFVFISGLVMGIVYAGVFARGGARAVLAKSASRAATLYGLTIALTLAFAFLSSRAGMPWASGLSRADAGDFVFKVLTLQRTFYLTDVLLLYTFLVFAAGPILVALARGKAPFVLAGSFALWTLWQVEPERAIMPWAVDGNTVFLPAAWQVLFVVGLVIGYHRPALERRLGGLSPLMVLAISGALTALLVALYRNWPASWGTRGSETLAAEWFFDKSDVAPGRLASFAVLAVFSYATLTVLWTPVRRAFGWLLLPLGENALSAYALHIFIALLFTVAGPWLVGQGPRSAMENTVLPLLALLLTWAIVRAQAPALAQARSTLATLRLLTRVAVPAARVAVAVRRPSRSR